MDKRESRQDVIVERRRELSLAAVVDAAIGIAERVGVGPALDFMAAQGLDRAVSLRVLTSPEFHRLPTRP